MTGAYRDDLEAALQRADALERAAAELRERNRRIEAELAGGTTSAEPATRTAQDETAEHRDRPTYLVATEGGLLAASMAIGVLGFTFVYCGLTAHQARLAIFVAIGFGGFLAWLNLIPRVDPPGGVR